MFSAQLEAHGDEGRNRGGQEAELGRLEAAAVALGLTFHFSHDVRLNGLDGTLAVIHLSDRWVSQQWGAGGVYNTNIT